MAPNGMRWWRSRYSSPERSDVTQFTHGWVGALYAYKGLLPIVGVYMAWKTYTVGIVGKRTVLLKTVVTL